MQSFQNANFIVKKSMVSAGIYLFKTNTGNATAMCESRSKLVIFYNKIQVTTKCDKLLQSEEAQGFYKY